MTFRDYAALCFLTSIPLICFGVLWQMYTVLSESYTLNRYQNSKKMIWVAVSLFFSFSLSLYWFCPNARKKGIVFVFTGILGTILYGLGMWFKTHA